MVFIGEGLHDADATDIFFDTGVKIADTTIESMPCGGHAATVAQRDISTKRHDNRCD